MVEITRQRVEETAPNDRDRFQFKVARFEELDFAPGSQGMITSCISLHHVADKASLYRRLFELLSPGGTFRFADQLAGGSAVNHEWNWKRWIEFCRQPGHCDEAELRSLLDHAEAHDHYTPLGEHFELLRQAGFTQPDCVWRNLIWGIVTAEKP